VFLAVCATLPQASLIAKTRAQRKPKVTTAAKEGEAHVKGTENSGKQPFINPYGFIHLSKDVQEKKRRSTKQKNTDNR